MHSDLVAPELKRRPRRAPTRLLVLAIPALVLYVFVTVVPSIQGVGYAFTDWDGMSSDFSFVGMDNLVRVLTTPASLQALVNTVIIAVAFTIAQNVLGLLLALAVNTRIKSRNFLKVIFFIPAILTPLVVAYLWKYMLSPGGAINTLLTSMGLETWVQPWLGDPSWALFAIIVVLVWQYVGYSMIIFLAGLQGVPAEVIEAAKVDGAGPIRRLWSITLPLLAPATTINLMLSMLAGLKVFDHVIALTGGGPGGATHTLSTLLYQQAFSFGEMGRGVAMALVLTVIVAVIAVFQYRTLSKREVSQ